MDFGRWMDKNIKDIREQEAKEKEEKEFDSFVVDGVDDSELSQKHAEGIKDYIDADLLEEIIKQAKIDAGSDIFKDEEIDDFDYLDNNLWDISQDEDEQD